MCAQKLSFDYAHTLHTVRIVHNAHSVHRSRVQKGKSCDCINFVRATGFTQGHPEKALWGGGCSGFPAGGAQGGTPGPLPGGRAPASFPAAAA